MKHGGFFSYCFQFLVLWEKRLQNRNIVLSEDLYNVEPGGCRGQSLPEDLRSWEANAESQHRPCCPVAPHQLRNRIRAADGLISFVDWSRPQISSTCKMSRLFLSDVCITYHFLYIASLHTSFWKECWSLLPYISKRPVKESSATLETY